jgi:hypothetical protein
LEIFSIFTYGVIMTLKCPCCESQRIHTNNYGKKTGGTIGMVAGAAAGTSGAFAGTFAGAETGAMMGFIAGPAGTAIGAIAGAIIGGLFGGAAGCAAGATLGKVVDDIVFDNYACLDCGQTFGTSINQQATPAPTEESMSGQQAQAPTQPSASL